MLTSPMVKLGSQDMAHGCIIEGGGYRAWGGRALPMVKLGSQDMAHSHSISFLFYYLPPQGGVGDRDSVNPRHKALA